MNVVLVDDEVGIREGLAAFLRFKGHRVVTAPSCAAALELLAAESVDVVVTDWRLPDGCGRDVLRVCRSPAIVMSGYPEEVSGLAERVRVIVKPVQPADLLALLEETCTQAQRPPRRSVLDELPVDTRDRAQLALALLCDMRAEVLDDGAIVVVRTVDPVPAAQLAQLRRLGGDLRADERGLELRFYRDGHPEEGIVVTPDEPWPRSAEPIVVDLDSAPCTPQAFLELLERCAAAQGAGQRVQLIHVPAHLRLWLEVLDRTHDMPKRARSGPRLPEVQAQLWS